MLAKAWLSWPMMLLILHQSNADVSHLSKNYLPPDKEHSSHQQPLADEVATQQEHSEHSNDGAYYPMSGLMLPTGYAIPTGSNVPPSPVSPPNFPLPIYPPFFGFNGGGGGAGQGFGQVPPGFESQFNHGPFPVGPQGPQFPVGPQGPQFPVGPQPGAYPTGPQNGQFTAGPQPGAYPQPGQFAQPGNPFQGGQQGAPFPGNPYPGGPQPGSFPVGPPPGSYAPMGPPPGPFPFPPDYLTTQGLPAQAMQFAFQQNVGPMFGVPQQPVYPFQHQVNVGQPFSPSFGIPGQHYPQQPQQPFADEPRLETSEKPKISSAKMLAKLRNKETIYASNGGYIYKRAAI